jgi:hypothetical protein
MREIFGKASLVLNEKNETVIASLKYSNTDIMKHMQII